MYDVYLHPRKPEWFNLDKLHPLKGREVWAYYSVMEAGKRRNFVIRAFRTEYRKFFTASSKIELKNVTYWCDCTNSCPVWDPKLYDYPTLT